MGRAELIFFLRPLQDASICVFHNLKLLRFQVHKRQTLASAIGRTLCLDKYLVDYD